MISLVLFTPLEPYTFGTDQSFAYPGTGKTGKESYLASSHRLPEQTTLLGTLRYLILEKKGLLRTDYGYSKTELDAVCAIIGPESFGFQKTEQHFGELRGISPLFLFSDKDRHVFVKNPFHNTASGSGYEPMRLGVPLRCDAGETAFPLPGEYNAKDGYAFGFLDLETLNIHNELFRSDIVTGNRKAFGEEKKKGFYRRERFFLKEGYSFGVLVETAEGALPDTAFAYMGLKRSAFRVRVCPVDCVPEIGGETLSAAERLKRYVEARLCNGETWYYALSDLCLAEGWKPETFSIVEEKSIRNMETRYTETSEARRRKRSEQQFNLACAGSVFSGIAPSLSENGNLQTAGYNIICKLGGN